jgi:hypothetical protein
MGCCNEPAAALAIATADPTQHVNYAKGMVLGVDDFTQEFAYLAGRDQWLAREAIGYGTVSGLRVFAEHDAEGPRLHVKAGTALLPSGRLVCVPSDQCAFINRWLAKKDNAGTVNRLLNASPPQSPSSPPLSPPGATSGIVSLYLTLCYADCETRPVPIPGEPCRSGDELMKMSRIADAFRLELRGTAPAQAEEDSLRDFVRWIRENVHIVDSGGTPAATWLDALRPAAGGWLADASPALSPPASFDTLGDYLFDLAPPHLEITPDQVCEFLRVAFRFWVTELRPLWLATRCQRVMSADQDCVLLARVELEVEWIDGSPTGTWQAVSGPDSMAIDESTRPFITHLRLLQEWLLCSGGELASAITSPPFMSPPITSPAIVSPPIISPPSVSPPAAPDDADYIIASLNAALANAQSLGALSTGLLLNTVAAGTGTLSTAVAGTDYYAPGSTDVSVADGGTGTSTVPTDGQVLIASGGAYVPANLTGTANQIGITAGAGSVTIAAPQDLATTSSPQFNGLRTGASRTVGLTSSAAASVTLNVTHHVVVSTGDNNSAIILPQSNPNRGRVYVIKSAKTGAGIVTVTAAAGDNIDGAATVTLNVNRAITIISGGGNVWHVIARV